MVLRKDKRGKVKGTKKLSDKWIGPYFIIDCMESVFRVAEGKHTAKKDMKVIHHDNLKPYWMCSDDKPDNSWVFAVSKTYEGVAVERGCQTDPEPLLTEVPEAPVHKQRGGEPAPELVRQLKRKRGRPRKGLEGQVRPMDPVSKKPRRDIAPVVRRSERQTRQVKWYGV